MTLHRPFVLLFLQCPPKKGVFPSDLPGPLLTGETLAASKGEEYKGSTTIHFSFMCSWPSLHEFFIPHPI